MRTIAQFEVVEDPRDILADIAHAIVWEIYDANQAHGSEFAKQVYAKRTGELFDRLAGTHDPHTAQQLCQAVVDAVDSRAALLLTGQEADPSQSQIH